MLSWKENDKTEFSKFIRDISENTVNAKHILEDDKKKETKKISSKRQRIIDENNERIKKKIIR